MSEHTQRMFSSKVVTWAAQYAGEEQFSVVWEYAKDTDSRAALAVSTRLPASLRQAARTSPHPKVRKSFASRSDLTSAEVTAILNDETRAEISACVLSRPMDPAVLDSIAERGRAAMLDALIRNCDTVQLHTSPKATKAALVRAVNSPEATHKNSRQFWATVSEMSVSLLNNIDNINSFEAAYAVLGNANVWHCPEVLTRALNYVPHTSTYGQNNLMTCALESLHKAQNVGVVVFPTDSVEALNSVAQLSNNMEVRVHTIFRALAAKDAPEATKASVEDIATLDSEEARTTAVVALWCAGHSYTELEQANPGAMPLLEMLVACPNRSDEVTFAAQGRDQYTWDTLLGQMLQDRGTYGEARLRTALSHLPGQMRLYNFSWQLARSFDTLEEETKRTIPAYLGAGSVQARWQASPEMGWLVDHAIASAHDTVAYLSLLEGILPTWSGSLGELVDSLEVMLSTGAVVSA